jgi:integrase/recombinase XerD
MPYLRRNTDRPNHRDMAGGGVAVAVVELVAGFSTYQRYRGFSPKTILRRAWTINHLAAHIDPRPLTEATPDDVIGFLSERPTAQTRYSLLCDIRCFYRWAILHGHAEHDPTVTVDPPKVPQRAATPLTVEQIRRALMAAPTRSTELAILLGAYAGLRVSEIAVLHTDNLAHRSRIIVRNGKGGKDRIVPVAPELALALARHMGTRTGRVFPGATPGSISERIRRTFRLAGIAARPHDLRHSFATAAARRSNGNVVLVASLLGHADTKTTQRYIGWCPSGVDVVDDLYGGDDAA